VSTERAAAPIPILMYHNVSAHPPGSKLPSLHVRPGQLARHFALLRVLGFRGISISESMPFLTGERSGRVAVLTFDDGYVDNLENALPVLQRFGFSATCYVPSALIGRHNEWDAGWLGARKPIMDRAQLRAWCAAGMEVGAHTRTHPHLPACSDAEVRDEVMASRKELEDAVGLPVEHFCYPYGEYDRRALEAAREAGYTTATSTRRGRARPGDDPHQLRRVLVRGTEGMHKLVAKLVSGYEDRRGRGSPEL
jgi:peptidoglycan/xylan/chitin deacetylase (PgdA/CDA1 family)